MLFKLAFTNGGISFTRLHVFAIYLLRYLILEPFRLAEVFIYDRKIKSHRLHRDPVFVLGHWRSGTSHLQNLLRCDTRTTSITIYTSLFADNFFLTESWLKPILNGICRLFNVQYSIQRTPMNLDISGELDAALCSMCSEYSYTFGHLFPTRFEKWTREKILFEQVNPDKWLEEYDFMIRKLSYKSKGKFVIVKSPGDTARAAQLLSKYPNAKFIYIHRDPTEVFYSNRYLWSVIQRENALQKISRDEIDRLIIDTYSLLIKKYVDQRKRIPASQLVEVKYSDLQDDAIDTMRKIYTHLGLGEFPGTEIAEFVTKNKDYSVKSHSGDEEMEKEVRKKWNFTLRDDE